MKKRHFLVLLGFGIVCTALLLVVVLTREQPDTFAGGVSQQNLPKGVKMRLGTGEIREVAYSPKGDVLAVAGSIGVWIYDTKTYQLIDLLAGHTGQVKSISFSQDGTLLASGSADGTVHIWDMATRSHKRTFTGYGSLQLAIDGVEDLTFCGNTLLLVHGGIHTDLWDVDQVSHKKHLGYDVLSPVLSPDGQKLAQVRSNEVRIRDIGAGEDWVFAPPTKDPKVELVYWGSAELFSPDGQMFAVVSKENLIYLWDVNTKAHKKTLRGHKESRIESMAFSADGQVLASGDSDATIRLWDVKTGKQKRTLRRHWFPMAHNILNFLERRLPRVYSLSFSADGQTLASVNSDNTISIWDVNTGKQKKMLSGQALSVESMAFSPDGKTLAGGGDILQLWDADTGARKQILKGHKGSVKYISFSPNGQTLASIGFDKTIRLWDVSTGRLQLKIKHRHKGSKVGWYDLSFSPDSQTLIGVGGAYDSIIPDKPGATLDTVIYLWDVDPGGLKKTFNVNEVVGDHFILGAFSPDGQMFACVLGSGSLRRNSIKDIHLWDMNAGTLKKTLRSHTAHITRLLFSPDSKTLAGIGQQPSRIILWDVGSGTYKQIFGLPVDVYFITNIAFSPEGETLAVWGRGRDPLIYLWDVETETQVGTLTGHTKYVKDVSFSPNGKTLVSTSEDGTIIFWDLTLHRMTEKE